MEHILIKSDGDVGTSDKNLTVMLAVLVKSDGHDEGFFLLLKSNEDFFLSVKSDGDVEGSNKK